jgi:murein DD-endopeptidase MepM/ murein hydrolase activator NlpD
MFRRLLSLFTILSCFLLATFTARCQSLVGEDYCPPLNIPLSISGNFGEIRPNTFHAGIDFKTNAMVGLNVYAVDSGYVSRIKVDLNGFGKALYIDHPNGTTSVYGHLEVFRDDIDRYCKLEQYKLKQFGIDIALKPNEIKVKKGDIIAFAGNRGGSSGPHMHFEIRDTKTQATLNVFKHTNIVIPDTTHPQIEKVWLYPLGENSLINNSENPVNYSIITLNGESSISAISPILARGEVGVGLQVYDLSSNSLNRIGIYSIEMYVNDSLIFEQVLDSLFFDKMRYVNSLIDYEYYMKNGIRINRLFVQPNNHLDVYRSLKNRGVIDFTDTLTKKVRIRVTDDFSNKSEFVFEMKGNVMESTSKTKPIKPGKLMHYREENVFVTDKVKLFIPKNALYDDLYFEYSKHHRQVGYFSEVHQIHNPYTPLHKTCTLSIKPMGLPSVLFSKALLVSTNQSGRVVWSGGEYKDGFVTAHIRTFGNYMVAVDTIPPQVQPLFCGNNFTDWAVMAFTIKDNLSGIGKYVGKIDGQWALFEYDPKQDLLYYRFDADRMQFAKNHRLDLVVSDEKGNKSRYSAAFFK